MAVLIELLAMLAFLIWAIAHTHRRINWYQDDVDAEAFLTALTDFGQAMLSAADATAVLVAMFREVASQTPTMSSPGFEATVDENGLEWVDITPFVDARTFRAWPDYS